MEPVRVTFEYRFQKVLAALVYLASQPKRVTHLDKYKAIKLIFFADKNHLLRYGEPIFGDYYRALEHGPVPQQTLDRLNLLAENKIRGSDVQQMEKALMFITVAGHDWPVLVAQALPDMGHLSELERQALVDAVEKYGTKSFEVLKEASHTPAWHKVWDPRPAHLDAVPMWYEDFFEGEHAEEGALDHMIEEFSLRRAFSGRP